MYICICICICVYVYVYVYVYMYICIYIYEYMYIGIYVYMDICVYVYMCICVYVYMCICVHVYMCICVYVYMCTCVYVYMCTCVHVYMCICVYVYVYVYVYICMSSDGWCSYQRLYSSEGISTGAALRLLFPFLRLACKTFRQSRQTARIIEVLHDMSTSLLINKWVLGNASFTEFSELKSIAVAQQIGQEHLEHRQTLWVLAAHFPGSHWSVGQSGWSDAWTTTEVVGRELRSYGSYGCIHIPY